jgi:hypothetical protein
MDLKAVVEEFAERIQGLLEAQSMEKAKAEILGAFGISAPRKPGRPPKTFAAAAAAKPVVMKARRKLPPQYCPVPGCKDKAAPIFGMVCSKHKDVPKALIKKYREARRAKKAGVQVSKKSPTKRAKRVVKKTKRAAPVAKKMKQQTAKKKPKRTGKNVAKSQPPKEVTSPATAPTPSVAPAA